MPTLAYRAEDIMQFFWPRDGQTTLPLRPIILVLALLVAACLLWWLWKTLRIETHRSEPMRLFNQTATELGLNWSQRWTLYRIAQRRGLSNPLTLLVCDAVLTFHADQLAQEMGPSSGSHLQRRVAAIRDRLFSHS